MLHFLSRSYFILSAFIMSLMFAGLADAAPNNKATINIGIYAPFSSKSAFIGRHILGAMEMARGQLKATNIDYSFYTLDTHTHTQSSNAANTLQKFINAHHINVLITEGSASGSIVAPLAKKNNIIHFCMSNDATLADGKNNFLARSPNHKQAAVLLTAIKPEFIAQFKREYFSHPVTEAGYAFDIFQALNSSAVIAMKTNPDFSSKHVATNLKAIDSRKGVLGFYNMDKKGVLYHGSTLTA